MPFKILSRYIRILCAVVCAAGCATPTEVVSLYRADVIAGAPYDRILILNVTSDRQQQADFETEVMRRLRAEGSRPFAAHRLLGYE